MDKPTFLHLRMETCVGLVRVGEFFDHLRGRPFDDERDINALLV
ncbi:MAG: hypothetical protein U5N86_08220 [Planctomycetota bacterium]|nr:hypothetical protein [Planctomycetota bacterium]